MLTPTGVSPKIYGKVLLDPREVKPYTNFMIVLAKSSDSEADSTPEHVPGGICGRLRTCFLVLFVSLLTTSTAWSMTVSAVILPGPVFTSGLKQYRAGKLDRAARIWRNVLSDPTYGPVAYLLLAKASQKLGNHKDAEAIIRDFFQRYPHSVYNDTARDILTDALYDEGRPEATRLLSQMISNASEKEKPALIFRLAKLEKRLGDHCSAASHYRILYLNYPASIEGLKAGEALAWMVFNCKIPKPEYSESDQLARAGRLYACGRFDLAAAAYQTLLKSKPSDKELMLKLARCKFKGRQNRKAITLMMRVLKGDVTQHQRLEALHLLSLIYWRLDRDKEFEECSREIIDKGTPRYRRRALFNLGAHSMERKKYSEAETLFNRLIKLSPDRSIKADARWKIAWIKYWKRKYTDAAMAFGEARTLSPRGGFGNATKYWEARSLILAERPREAIPLLKEIIEANPLDYYADEASHVLKTLGVKYLSNSKPKWFPDIVLTPSQSSDKLVMAATKLMGKGLYQFALINLEALPKSMKSSPAVAFLSAKAAYNAGKYFRAQEILRAAFGRMVENPPVNAPAEFIDIAYPRIHFAETTKMAEKYSMDPNLVWAVVRQESRYDASAVSPAGALGLMQVTPEAAGLKKMAGGIPAGAIAKIMDPKQNIAHGIRILSKNLRIFKGKVIPAVAAYNADVRKVKDWMKKNRRMKKDEFVESIPYLETRIYVKKVLAGYRAYATLHRRKALAGYW
jgi:peptidoglycan lytic transglycosylase